MKVYPYQSYQEYLVFQEETNARKVEKTWAVKEGVVAVSDYIKEHIPQALFGICHGTRNGKEIEWFRAELGIDVVGTEIAKTARDFPNTIQWDFHEIKDEWLGNIDFIFSNSFDHAFDPTLCLERWLSCLSDSGRCFIEWSVDCERARKSDPVGATLEEIEQFFVKNAVLEDTLVVSADQLEEESEEFLVRTGLNWRIDRHIFVVRRNRTSRLN